MGRPRSKDKKVSVTFAVRLSQIAQLDEVRQDKGITRSVLLENILSEWWINTNAHYTCLQDQISCQ